MVNGVAITAGCGIAAMLLARTIKVRAVIAAVWTAGLILDKLQFWNHYTDELNDRNKILKKLET